MAKKSDRADECVVLHDRTGMYVVFHGVRIAKRGAPGTPQARTWLSLVPGYRVFDEYKRGGLTIVVEYNGVRCSKALQ
jgi:hypothetical protein